MRKNVIFVFVFAAVILGLVKLHTLSLEEPTSQSVSLKGIAHLSYPASVELRDDIPFGVLINPDDKKILPDSVDYEQFRPALILLEKGFNEKDSMQLSAFPNIVANALLLDGFDASILETEYVESLSNNVRDMISQNAERTSSIVSEWNATPIKKINGATVLRFEYKLQNQNKKELNIIVSYLFKGNKQVEVTLSAPNKDLKKWLTIYNEILNNVSLD